MGQALPQESRTQNAGVRLARNTAERLDRTHKKPSMGERERFQERVAIEAYREVAANDPRYSSLGGIAANDSSYEEDAKMIVKELPQKPDFPQLMIFVAGFKDLLDALDLTGVGAILTTVLSLLMAMIIFIWFLGKMEGGWWKKKMIGWFWRRYALALVVELVPVLKIIPATTILVLMAHYRETKIVQMLNAVMEKIHEMETQKFKKGGARTLQQSPV